jgi:chain length determinant protein EpsF
MDIRQFLIILRARRKLIGIVLASTVGLAILLSLVLPNTYTATASVIVDVKTDPIAGMVLPVQMMTSYMTTQIDVITSQRVALRVVDLLKLADNPTAREQFTNATGGKGSIRHWLADLLLRKVSVKPSRESNVVDIEFKAADPEFAAVVANAFAQAYIDTNLDLRVEPARQAALWFDGQMKTLRDNMEAAQSKLSKYQQSTGIVASDERLDVETARLAELSSQLVVAQAATYESQNRERKAKELLASGASADELVEVLNQPGIIGLKAEIGRSEAKLNEMESQLGKNHPQIQQSQAQIAEMRRKLQTEIGNITKSLGNSNTINQRRESEIKAALEAQRKKVLEVKQQRDEISVQMREVDAAQKAFDLSMSRFTQSKLESQTNQTNIILLNPAIAPLSPSFPKLFLNIALALVLGSMLAVGLAFGLEFADRRVRSADDLKAMFDLPMLGVLAKERMRRQHRAQAEAFVRRVKEFAVAFIARHRKVAAS